MSDDLSRPYDLGKGADWRSFTLRMPTAVSKRLANHCEVNGRVKAWVLVRALEEWLDRNDNGDKEATQ